MGWWEWSPRRVSQSLSSFWWLHPNPTAPQNGGGGIPAVPGRDWAGCANTTLVAKGPAPGVGEDRENMDNHAGSCCAGHKPASQQDLPHPSPFSCCSPWAPDPQPETQPGDPLNSQPGSPQILLHLQPRASP